MRIIIKTLMPFSLFPLIASYLSSKFFYFWSHYSSLLEYCPLRPFIKNSYCFVFYFYYLVYHMIQNKNRYDTQILEGLLGALPLPPGWICKKGNFFWRSTVFSKILSDKLIFLSFPFRVYDSTHLQVLPTNTKVKGY